MNFSQSIIFLLKLIAERIPLIVEYTEQSKLIKGGKRLETMLGVFDGEHLLLSNHKLIPLKDVNRGCIELKPYLMFPVEMVGVDGEYEEIPMLIIYPHTSDREFGANQLVYGEVRQTRIHHFLIEGNNAVQRKTDLRKPHHVTTLGYRHLTLEMNDGQEIEVAIDGNCRHIAPGITQLYDGCNRIELIEFFDRPSEFVNIIKKAGIEVYSN